MRLFYTPYKSSLLLSDLDTFENDVCLINDLIDDHFQNIHWIWILIIRRIIYYITLYYILYKITLYYILYKTTTVIQTNCLLKTNQIYIDNANQSPLLHDKIITNLYRKRSCVVDTDIRVSSSVYNRSL